MTKFGFPLLPLVTLTFALLCGVQGHKERFVVDGQDEVNLESLVLALKQNLTSLKAEVVSLSRATASVYIRWGRKVCPGNDSELIYEGFTAGKYFDETGGGDNYLCLPHNPTFAKSDPGFQNYRGRIYGAEFEMLDDPAVLFGKPVHNQDAPCAVCRIPRSTNTMIPARKDCYPGWRIEYWGYLMTMAHGHKASTDYICIDSQPEFIEHGAADANQGVLYPVEAVCGTLSCPPYANGQELTCVVCSK